MTREVLALPMECWRWIPGYEGWYQVSTRGRVRSVDRWMVYADGRKYFYKGHIIKPGRDNNGYLHVTLYRNGKGRTFLVHRLVAMVWLDNPENKPEVNHRNEQKDMNFVENLSYCTRIENVRWGTARKRQAASLSRPVEAVDPNTGVVVKEFSSTNEAGRNGFNQGHVSDCCLGKNGHRTHRGLIWRFKER